ncbi:MAG TPA: class C beta-lactamase [Rhodopila sp.]|nr:class C beta-lactamase [Rhodopila sp.]
MPLLISRRQGVAGTLLVSALGSGSGRAQAQPRRSTPSHIVNESIRPIMQEHHVPGMAVAVTVRGKQYVFNFGVAARAIGQKVTNDTIFEIGSLSKTFTATLAAYAQARGALSFSDRASKYLPALAGGAFDRVSLLDLGTYTAGGLPLQFPDDVTDQAKMVAYFKTWRPAYAPGTHRLYSNPSMGLFGYLAARSMGRSFDDLMEKTLFPMFGLSNTYIRIPQVRMGGYAWGNTKGGRPIRVAPGVFDSEAYGVKTTAADMIRFVEANIDSAGLEETLQRAIAATQTGYDKVGDMIQGLGWERYTWPTVLDRLLAGNSSQMSLQVNAVTQLEPPMPPAKDMLLNKTGSTNGFGAYAAFVPARRIGVVLLANKNYPIPARVTAAYRILSAIDGEAGSEGPRSRG